MKFLIYEEKKLQNLRKMMNDINMLIMVDKLFILFLVLDKRKKKKTIIIPFLLEKKKLSFNNDSN